MRFAFQALSFNDSNLAWKQQRLPLLKFLMDLFKEEQIKSRASVNREVKDDALEITAEQRKHFEQMAQNSSAPPANRFLARLCLENDAFKITMHYPTLAMLLIHRNMDDPTVEEKVLKQMHQGKLVLDELVAVCDFASERWLSILASKLAHLDHKDKVEELDKGEEDEEDEDEDEELDQEQVNRHIIKKIHDVIVLMTLGRESLHTLFNLVATLSTEDYLTWALEIINRSLPTSFMPSTPQEIKIVSDLLHPICCQGKYLSRLQSSALKLLQRFRLTLQKQELQKCIGDYIGALQNFVAICSKVEALTLWKICDVSSHPLRCMVISYMNTFPWDEQSMNLYEKCVRLILQCIRALILHAASLSFKEGCDNHISAVAEIVYHNLQMVMIFMRHYENVQIRLEIFKFFSWICNDKFKDKNLLIYMVEMKKFYPLCFSNIFEMAVMFNRSDIFNDPLFIRKDFCFSFDTYQHDFFKMFFHWIIRNANVFFKDEYGHDIFSHFLSELIRISEQNHRVILDVLEQILPQMQDNISLREIFVWLSTLKVLLDPRVSTHASASSTSLLIQTLATLGPSQSMRPAILAKLPEHFYNFSKIELFKTIVLRYFRFQFEHEFAALIKEYEMNKNRSSSLRIRQFEQRSGHIFYNLFFVSEMPAPLAARYLEAELLNQRVWASTDRMDDLMVKSEVINAIAAIRKKYPLLFNQFFDKFAKLNFPYTPELILDEFALDLTRNYLCANLDQNKIKEPNSHSSTIWNEHVQRNTRSSNSTTDSSKITISPPSAK